MFMASLTEKSDDGFCCKRKQVQKSPKDLCQIIQYAQDILLAVLLKKTKKKTQN